MKATDWQRQRRRWGVGHTLVLLVLVALAPFIVLEAYRGEQNVDRQRQAVTQQAQTQAQAEAGQVDEYLRLNQRYLATLAANGIAAAPDAGSSPTQLQGVLQAASVAADSIVLLADKDGTVIAASQNPQTWLGRTALDPRIIAEDRAATSGTTSVRMADRVKRVIAYQAVQGAPWLIVAGVPQTEADAEAQRTLLHVVEQATLALLAAVLLAWAVLRRVVRPIHVLAAGARDFAAGHLDRRIALRRHDELGDLALALNGMAAALRHRLDEQAAHARALQELSNLQTEFVATASHELRTPVTAIRTYVEALLRPDILDEETRRECLEGIDRSSERLSRLVQTLLDASRIDSGRAVVHLAAVDVGAVAGAAVAQATVSDDRAVEIRVSADLPETWADFDRLEDVLANLIGNAVRFSARSEPILVEAWQEGDEVRIAVRDRGVGIPEEELPRIFDRFHQVRGGTNRPAGGAGLGLYIARAYVNAMGGRLWVESTLGVGSTFSLALPLAGGKAAAPTQEEGDAGVADAARRR